MFTSLSIIIPVYNEENVVNKRLTELQWLNSKADLLFVDGGSTDQTVAALQQQNMNVISSSNKGRGAQLCVGIQNVSSNSNAVLMLHIDTQLPETFMDDIENALKSYSWGFFKINLASNRNIFYVIEFMMNIRSKYTSIATGDQAIFVKKDLIQTYANEIAKHKLMEDIFISKSLRKHHGYAIQLNQKVTTSTRYWEKQGIIKTIVKMWIFRFLYLIGVSPNKLYKLYYQ